MAKEYYNHWLPKLLRAKGIAINARIYYSVPSELVTSRLRRHEQEHIKQYKERGTAIFLLTYLFEYLRNRLSGMTHYQAYRNISYEQEARRAKQEVL